MIDPSIGGGPSRARTMTENPLLQITIAKLDESNYLLWSCSALLVIQIGLSNYFMEEAEEPKLGDSSYS